MFDQNYDKKEMAEEQREPEASIINGSNGAITMNEPQSQPPTRAALEPTGFYSSTTTDDRGERCIQQTINSAHHSIRADNEQYHAQQHSSIEHEAQHTQAQQHQAQQHQAQQIQVKKCDEIPSSNHSDNIVPPWSHLDSQFPLPKKDSGAPTLTHINNAHNDEVSARRPKKCELSSYMEQWSQLKVTNSIPSEQQFNREENAVASSSMSPSTMMKTERERAIVNDKIQDDFFHAIATDKIQIKNDTSITGRYNKNRKYEPFGFVPSTEDACKEEIYEIIKPSSSLLYNCFEDGEDKKNTPLQHYQSFDPKTLQYSPQPYNILQSLNGGAQFPVSGAAAKSRAALLSIMSTNNDNTSDLNSDNNNNIINNNLANNNSLTGSSSRRDLGENYILKNRRLSYMDPNGTESGIDFYLGTGTNLNTNHPDAPNNSYCPDTSRVLPVDVSWPTGDSHNNVRNRNNHTSRTNSSTKKRSQQSITSSAKKKKKNGGRKKDNSPPRRSNRKCSKRRSHDDPSTGSES
jgi:hypothetical protein